jgi:hypothetical protein
LSHNSGQTFPYMSLPIWGGVARIVPEFRARARPEKRITFAAARNKKFFAGGVFSLFNCCTNVVIRPKAEDGQRKARGGRLWAEGQPGNVNLGPHAYFRVWEPYPDASSRKWPKGAWATSVDGRQGEGPLPQRTKRRGGSGA